MAWREHPGRSRGAVVEIVVSLRVSSCEGRSEQGTSWLQPLGYHYSEAYGEGPSGRLEKIKAFG